MLQFSCRRLVRATPALLACAAGTRLALEAVAQRLPPAGMTASQLQALLEDEHPTLRLPSIYQALSAHPDLFALEPGTKGKWLVRPARPAGGTLEELRAVERYCARVGGRRGNGGPAPFIPLEEALIGSGVDSPAVVERVVAGESSLLEVRVGLSLRARRAPRAAHVFVDGDELPAVAVDDMCTQLALIKEECSVCIIRRPGSAPLSAVDTVSSDLVPTYMCIEKKARELRHRSPVVLRDVIYLCSGRQFAKYAEHVASVNQFPDADVYVCCPSRVEVVQKKTVVPL